MLTYTIKDLEEVRDAEMDLLLRQHKIFFADADVLEIGAGTCRQLMALGNFARLAIGVDIPSSSYNPSRRVKFAWFDGVNLPFQSNSFDVIYSSNTMEHVIDEVRLHNELRRVLRPGGVAIHVVPSSTWRLWTMATYYVMLPRLGSNFLQRRRGRNEGSPSATGTAKRAKSFVNIMLDVLCPMRHGERGNRFTEWWHFRRSSWEQRFEQLDWAVVGVEGIGLFYTGYLLGARFLSISLRKRLSRFLGSSCLIFVLRHKPIL